MESISLPLESGVALGTYLTKCNRSLTVEVLSLDLRNLTPILFLHTPRMTTHPDSPGSLPLYRAFIAKTKLVPGKAVWLVILTSCPEAAIILEDEKSRGEHGPVNIQHHRHLDLPALVYLPDDSSHSS